MVPLGVLSLSLSLKRMRKSSSISLPLSLVSNRMHPLTRDSDRVINRLFRFNLSRGHCHLTNCSKLVRRTRSVYIWKSFYKYRQLEKSREVTSQVPHMSLRLFLMRGIMFYDCIDCHHNTASEFRSDHAARHTVAVDAALLELDLNIKCRESQMKRLAVSMKVDFRSPNTPPHSVSS